MLTSCCAAPVLVTALSDFVAADGIVHSSVPLGEFPTMYEVQNERLATFLSLSLGYLLACVGS